MQAGVGSKMLHNYLFIDLNKVFIKHCMYYSISSKRSAKNHFHLFPLSKTKYEPKKKDCRESCEEALGETIAIGLIIIEFKAHHVTKKTIFNHIQ